MIDAYAAKEGGAKMDIVQYQNYEYVTGAAKNNQTLNNGHATTD